MTYAVQAARIATQVASEKGAIKQIADEMKAGMDATTAVNIGWQACARVVPTETLTFQIWERIMGAELPKEEWLRLQYIATAPSPEGSVQGIYEKFMNKDAFPTLLGCLADTPDLKVEWHELVRIGAAKRKLTSCIRDREESEPVVRTVTNCADRALQYLATAHAEKRTYTEKDRSAIARRGADWRDAEKALQELSVVRALMGRVDERLQQDLGKESEHILHEMQMLSTRMQQDEVQEALAAEPPLRRRYPKPGAVQPPSPLETFRCGAAKKRLACPGNTFFGRVYFGTRSV